MNPPMDPQVAAAAHALTAGDPLGALNRVALRDDAPALALRGTAMAQLGEFDRAKTLVQRAARAFGRKQPVARARCTVAAAEIALASRDLGWPPQALDTARETLEAHGDRVNAAHARHLEARRHLLLGQLDAAERILDALDLTALPPALVTIHELASAGIAIRRVRTKAAAAALTRAEQAVAQARIPALAAEVESASCQLTRPAARLVVRGEARHVRLAEVEEVLASKALVVDTCRYVIRDTRSMVWLPGRPILMTLAQALAAAWPGDVPREALIRQAFRAKAVNESHRARLRVEIGRLRSELRALARIEATNDGFVLIPHQATEVAVLAPPVEERHGAVLALLADGESWSSSALAQALGVSQRTVQRALDALAQAGKVQAFGRGRARLWVTPSIPGFTTTLLLPAPPLQLSG